MGDILIVNFDLGKLVREIAEERDREKAIQDLQMKVISDYGVNISSATRDETGFLCLGMDVGSSSEDRQKCYDSYSAAKRFRDDCSDQLGKRSLRPDQQQYQHIFIVLKKDKGHTLAQLGYYLTGALSEEDNELKKAGSGENSITYRTKDGKQALLLAHNPRSNIVRVDISDDNPDVIKWFDAVLQWKDDYINYDFVPVIHTVDEVREELGGKDLKDLFH